MLLYCNCLNVVIATKTERREVIDASLRSILGNDPFFKEEIAAIDLLTFEKKMPPLEEVHRCGSWVIHRCINCSMYTYAFNEETDKDTVIINNRLLTDPKRINELKNCERYSPAFQMVVNEPRSIDLNREVMSEIKLHPKLASWLQKQTLIVEEQVQEFTQRKYGELEMLRMKAQRQQAAINWMTGKAKSYIKSSDKVPPRSVREMSPSTSKKSTRSSKTAVRHKELHSPNGNNPDSEGLFALDDIDNPSDSILHVDTCSDDSDNDNDVSPPPSQRDFAASAQVARSLPMAVPQFIDEKNRQNPSSGSPQVPTDIAASIKALAKSVHGDAVFGELPRPRFSTHL